MPDNDHDERPKRSFKEIDQRRAGTSRAAESGAGFRGEARPSHAYNAYKNQLGKLFDRGGMVPGAPVAEGRAARLAAERSLLAHTHPKALQEAALAFVDANGLPEDIEVLMALLAVGHEPLLLEVVEALGAVVEAGTCKRTQALKARLKALVVDCDAPKIIRRAKTILAAL